MSSLTFFTVALFPSYPLDTLMQKFGSNTCALHGQRLVVQMTKVGGTSVADLLKSKAIKLV
jgi:hypothetical protein